MAGNTVRKRRRRTLRPAGRLENLVKSVRLDRTTIEVVTLDDLDGEDVVYWQAKSVRERLRALEFLRQVHHGYDACAALLQRVIEIVAPQDLAHVAALDIPRERAGGNKRPQRGEGP
jgi:hypothetical protein